MLQRFSRKIQKYSRTVGVSDQAPSKPEVKVFSAFSKVAESGTPHVAAQESQGASIGSAPGARSVDLSSRNHVFRETG